MTHQRIQTLAAAAALAAATLAPAAMAASTCYTVYDRAGEIVYRDFVQPFDGATDPASPGNAAMRSRGENIVFFEADFCVPVALGGANARPATTAEIVAAIPAFGSRGVGTGASPAGGVYGSGSAAPASESRPAPVVYRGGPAARIAAPAAAAVQSRAASYR